MLEVLQKDLVELFYISFLEMFLQLELEKSLADLNVSLVDGGILQFIFFFSFKGVDVLVHIFLLTLYEFSMSDKFRHCIEDFLVDIASFHIFKIS